MISLTKTAANNHSKFFCKYFALFILLFNVGISLATTPNSVANSANANTLILPPPSSAEHKVLSSVDTTLQHLTHTYYRYGGTYFNKIRGIYEVDCSAYVDTMLKQSNMTAFNTLINFSRSIKPSSQDYYSFFKHIPYHSSLGDWYRVETVSMLRAGDIIVYRYQHLRHQQGGHVMIVVGAPKADPNDPAVYYVRVSDSANSGHADDSRGKKSGVGVGTLLIKTNQITGIPTALAWTNGARWEERLDVVMARPVG